MTELKRPEIPDRIDSIELFLVPVETARHFSYGTWDNRQQVWMRIGAGEHGGWCEAIASTNKPDLDIAEWGAPFLELAGMGVSDALDHLRAQRNVWDSRRLEMAEMGVLDLAGRIGGVPTMELLGLTLRAPVAGLYCILEDDADRVREMAQVAIDQKLHSHVKLKIFGKAESDAQLVRAAREVLGEETYLVADANGGYAPEKVEDMEALAADMRTLHEAGLSACEDPAKMPDAGWVKLQESVGDLDLIPDYPMRPAWRALEVAIPGMGRIYNLHPACMGSLIDTVALARRVRELGAAVMIGDSSLVGPACTAWQQVAIGLGAAWVEALEKPQESDVLQQVTVRKATEQQEDGRFALRETLPGFGLELDVDLLREKCARSAVLR